MLIIMDLSNYYTFIFIIIRLSNYYRFINYLLIIIHLIF